MTKEEILSKYDGEYMDRDDILRAMEEYREQRWVRIADKLDEELMLLRIKSVKEAVTEEDLYKVQMMIHKSLDESPEPPKD